MRNAFRFLCLLITLLTAPILAQNKDPQLLLDEQLAGKAFQSQDYEQAKALYQQLYEKKKQSHHFNQYVECLFRLGDFDTAEKELKSFIKKNPSNGKARIDLIYAYASNDKKNKADDLFNEILNNLPESKNQIVNISNMLRGRMLNDYAIAILEKGAKTNEEGDPLYLERGNLYQSMINYQQAFEFYFLELEANPDQYNIIKNKLQTLLLYDVNKSITEEMRIALLKKTQEQPDNEQFGQLLMWFALQNEDYDIALAQCKSLDRRNNDQDQPLINLAHICFDNGQYNLAKDAFEQIIRKGKINPYYGDAVIGVIKTENQLFKNNPETEKKSYEKLSQEIENTYPDVGSKEYPELVEIQADIMAYHLNKSDQAISLLQQAIGQINNKIQQCRLKLKLADIYLYNDEVWEATLLYSQVDKSMKEEPLVHEARFRNAQLRYFIGEFAWAETQLNVLKAATSKLIANDAMTLSLIISDNLEYDTTGTELKRLARADYKIYQHKPLEALPILDSICIDGNEISMPHALYRIAEIKEKEQDYPTADSLYLKIVEQFPDSYMADDALMRAALLEHQQLKVREAAKTHYEQLIDQYPTSLYTAQAKKNYRKL